MVGKIFRLILLLALIAVDQLTTFWIGRNYPGLMAESGTRFIPWSQSGLLIVAVIVYCVLFMLFHKKHKWTLILILAGLMSNIIMFLTRHNIPDYIHILWWKTNLADLYILIGLLRILI